MTTKAKSMATKKPKEMVDESTEKAFSIFETRDINLAAYLILKEYEIKSVVVDQNRVIFGFIDRPLKIREQDVLDFYNNKGGYLTYTDAWKNLKSMLHNYKK